MITLPAELARAIEDYRFESRLKTEAEAIRQLIEAGLTRRQNLPSRHRAAAARVDKLSVRIKMPNAAL